MSKPGEFTDLLNHYANREKRSARKLAELTEIPRRSIENWLDGTSSKPRNWQDVVNLSIALKLNVSEANDLLQAAKHATLDVLRATVKNDQDRELLEKLSSTTASHEPNSMFYGDQVTGDKFEGDQVAGHKFGGDQVGGHKFEGNNVTGNWVMGDNFSGSKIVANNTGDVVMNDQYKANTMNFGSHPSSSQQSSRQTSSERSPYSDVRQPFTQRPNRYESPDRSASVGTALRLVPPVVTEEVFQTVKALEAELSKGARADAVKVGKLLNQFQRERTVSEGMYIQLLHKIRSDFTHLPNTVRSTVRKRLERIH